MNNRLRAIKFDIGAIGRDLGSVISIGPDKAPPRAARILHYCCEVATILMILVGGLAAGARADTGDLPYTPGSASKKEAGSADTPSTVSGSETLEATEESGPPPWAQHLQDHLTIRLSQRLLLYPRVGSPEDNRVVAVWRAGVDYRVEPASWLRLKLAPRLIYDTRGDSEGFGPTADERPKKRRIFDFDTAEMGLLFGDFELAFGKRTYPVGPGDFFQPSRFMDALDLTEPTVNHLLGVPSAELRFAKEPIVLSAFAGGFVASRLAPTDSRWFPVSQEQIAIDPDQILLNRELPRRRLDDAQYGARAQLTLGPLELSLGVFRGNQTLPQFSIDFIRFRVGFGLPEGTFRYPRYTGYSATAQVDVFDTTFFVDSAWRHYRPSDGSSFVRTAAGASRTFFGIVGEDDELTLSLEGVFNLETRDGEAGALEELSDQGKLLNGVIAFAAGYRPTDAWRFDFVAWSDVSESTDTNVYLRSGVTWIPFDGLGLEVAGYGELFFGDDQEFATVGRYHDNGRFVLELHWTPF